jgi:hypothetical protein
VTVVPAFTFSSCGPKVKFPILTAIASAAQTGVAARRRKAVMPATTKFISDFLLDMFALNLLRLLKPLPRSVIVELSHNEFAFTEARLIVTTIYSRTK